MTGLVWDKIGDRKYETGLDKGVLYLPNGTAVAWNGLTSVIEKFNREPSPVYYDGMKINELIVLGDFSATMKAVTYPDEFIEIEGASRSDHNLLIQDQPPKVFGLSYRTKVGNDVEGDDLGYKIHLIYNVIAIPSEKAYTTMSKDPNLVEFEWDIFAIPVDCPGIFPTAHIIIDSRDVDPLLLAELEEMLYGNTLATATLLPMCQLLTYIDTWCRITITDHGDGSWSAVSTQNDLIQFSYFVDGVFTIFEANAIYTNEYTYNITDTCNVGDVPLINIIDHGDGTWTAETNQDDLFSIDENNLFQILNANAVFIEADVYQLSNTVE